MKLASFLLMYLNTQKADRGLRKTRFNTLFQLKLPYRLNYVSVETGPVPNLIIRRKISVLLQFAG